ncbi:hypothetical protein RFI_16310 [Reticulomyxa filosa]|uniref:UspA domain-containing protein n=1 Tax=Reticulomyxa filosa TaxID=46433 RepID=X6N598_RETFI|nr:hypothetical protein RFI_16310 [Reticulomyxa filosa]|eukprot:ETO20899.1 hypothetical protein RFI_16310 [Reticulomyxa filosa]
MTEKEEKSDKSDDTHTDDLVKQLRHDLDKIRAEGGESHLGLKTVSCKKKKKVYDHKGLRVILLSVDASEYSVKAIEWASKNTLRPTDVVVLMTVWEELIDLSTVPTAVDPIGSFFIYFILFFFFLQINNEEIQKHNEDHLVNAKKLLVSLYNAYLSKMKVLPLLVSSPNQGKPYIGKLICGAAKMLDVDLIVMGSRGLGKVKQFFMGSVSKHVVETSHCPVLIVKT